MKERTEILEETFRKLVEEKKFSSLRDLMATMYPADVAAILCGGDDEIVGIVAGLHRAAEKFLRIHGGLWRPEAGGQIAGDAGIVHPLPDGCEIIGLVFPEHDF